MKLLNVVALLALAVLVSGCATGSGDAPEAGAFDNPAQSQTGENEAAVPSKYRVNSVNVDVPETLVVSEANSYFPRGDIVWRGDPPGNRYEQITAIFQDGIEQGVSELQGDVPVDLDIEVVRFHSLTEKTRYTVGGVHSIRFLLSLRDAETGDILETPREVRADLKGYGGSRAIAADQEGQTQKVRITAHLAHVINVELTDPDGYKNERLGLIQLIDNQF